MAREEARCHSEPVGLPDRTSGDLARSETLVGDYFELPEFPLGKELSEWTCTIGVHPIHHGSLGKPNVR